MTKRKGPNTLDRKLRQAKPKTGNWYLKTKSGRQGFCEGIREGERRTQQLIAATTKTNRMLLELVDLIDTKYPVAGPRISFTMAERIVSGLKRPEDRKTCTHLANQLRAIVDDCQCTLGEDLAALENELVELVG